MNWTTHTPTEDGFYWLRHDRGNDEPCRLLIGTNGEIEIQLLGTEIPYELSDFENPLWMRIEFPE